MVNLARRHASACLEDVDRATYRTWLLYLAGSAVSFEEGLTSVAQLLLARRRSPRRRLSRTYMTARPPATRHSPGAVWAKRPRIPG